MFRDKFLAAEESCFFGWFVIRDKSYLKKAPWDMQTYVLSGVSLWSSLKSLITCLTRSSNSFEVSQGFPTIELFQGVSSSGKSFSFVWMSGTISLISLRVNPGKVVPFKWVPLCSWQILKISISWFPSYPSLINFAVYTALF